MAVVQAEDGTELLVLSRPVGSPTLPSGLTAAESEVVRLLLEGQSNRTIAAARGTSVRTVANQVASIFRKLAVSSRSELVARLCSGVR